MFSFCNQVVFKITKDCNLRCKYCYVADKDSYKGQKIDFELYKKIIQKIIEDRCKNHIKEPLSITWHGGEPTIVGAKYLYKLCDYARQEFRANNLPCRFDMQSNLTLINDEMLRVIKEFDIDVGASYDGIDKNNNLRTTSINSNKYKSILKKFEEYSAKRPGFLSVITKQNIDNYEKSFKFLCKNFHQDRVKANIVEDVSTPDHSDIEVSGKEFFEKIYKPEIEKFLKSKSFKHLESNTEFILKKFLVYSMFGNLPISPKGNCYIKYCGAGISVIELDPDGKAYFCGRYSKGYEEALIGHALDIDLFNLKQLVGHISILHKKQLFIKEHQLCDTCEAQAICDRGCMAFHYSKLGTWGIRQDLVCSRNKPLMDYLLRHQKQIIGSLVVASSEKKIFLINLSPLKLLNSDPVIYVEEARKRLQGLKLPYQIFYNTSSQECFLDTNK